MPVDASIYGAIQPVRPANRLAQLADVMRLEGLQNQNDAAMLTRRKAEREDAEVNALNAAYRDAVGTDGAVDRNKLYQAVAAGGLGSRLPAIQKSFADADTATTNQRKAEFDLRKQTNEIVGQAFMGVVQDPTPENAVKTIDLLGSRKYFTPQEVAEFKQIVSTNPQAIGPLAERMVRLTASVKDQTPTFETRNLGGTTDTLRRDPITGKVVTVNSAQNTATPGDLLTDRRTREEGALNRGVTVRGQDMTDKRARESNELGKIPPGYRRLPDGSLEAIPGGPAATGKALPTKLVNDLSEQAGVADATQRFASTFTDGFAGKTVMGDLSNTGKRVFGDDTGQAQWWQDYQLHEAQVRNKLFGASLTTGEQASWQKLAVTPRMDPKQVRENLARRAKIEADGLARLTKAAAAGGYNKEQIEALTGRPIGGPAADPTQAAAGANIDALLDKYK